MQLSNEQCKNWRKTIDQALPKILDVVSKSPGQVLVIGASILQIYHEAGWITKARATGDLDLSIGLVASKGEYESIRDDLIKSGYTASDRDRHYRLFSPVKLSLEVSYVDLLAHPQGTVSTREALSVMGVGNAYLQECAKNEESIRIVKLPNVVKEMLLKVRKEKRSSEPIFSNSEGQFLSYSAIQNAFNGGFEALKLPWRSTHICRHTFGTLALKATKSLSAVQAALGHRDIKMTQRYAKIVALVDEATAEQTAECIGLNG